MNISRLPGGILYANTYVLSSDDSDIAVIIDPTDAENLDRFLQQQNLCPVAIFLTHGHFDHISGLPDFLCRVQIPVYLHSGDGPMLSDPMLCGLHAFLPDAPFTPISSYEALADGDTLTFGSLSCRVISTPGHSKGSVCYLFNNVLFSGDTLFHAGVGRTDLWGGSTIELNQSLVLLRDLPPETCVYPGHGSMTTIGKELPII